MSDNLIAVIRSRGINAILVSDETWNLFCSWLNRQEKKKEKELVKDD